MSLQRKLFSHQDYICNFKSSICSLESSDQETFSLHGNEANVLCVSEHGNCPILCRHLHHCQHGVPPRERHCATAQGGMDQNSLHGANLYKPRLSCSGFLFLFLFSRCTSSSPVAKPAMAPIALLCPMSYVTHHYLFITL